MSRNLVQRRGVRGRRSFTLVELLVTITIIGILAAMVSGALIVARSSAREAATRATIAKLHNIIMAKYESYRTRRVPIDTTDQSPADASLARLRGLRDLMRMEMPERWSDITNAALYVPAPSLFQAYQSRYNNPNPAVKDAPAKCLYLIVTMGCGEDARRQFHQNEIATDTDGYSMFVDGWGKPIYFLRWAPGFNDSDLQRNVVAQTDLDANKGDEMSVWTTATTTSAANTRSAAQLAAQEDHDPLDPRKRDMVQTATAANPPRGWRLVPLIYSAGPDGEYGIANYPQDGSTYTWSGLDDHYGSGWGIPLSKQDGSVRVWVHFDNIHNHQNLTEAR